MTTTSGAISKCPLRQRAAVTLERAEVAFGDLRAAIVMFDDGAGGDLGW